MNAMPMPKSIIQKYDRVLHACADLLLEKEKSQEKNLKHCSMVNKQNGKSGK